MTSGNPISITNEQFERIVETCLNQDLELNFLLEKHQLEIWDGNLALGKIFLPWQLAWSEIKHQTYLKGDFHLALIMIRAGTAVSGYFHDGEMLDHKVFRAYMTRKKQGKSQIKYLKTKGKSRAGSRVRLEESRMFFQEINERLQSYHEQFPITNWGINCSRTLWPYLFETEPTPPFESKQKNLLSIPFHISNPNFEGLKHIHNQIRKFHIVLSDAGESIFEKEFQKNEDETGDIEITDDW